MGRGLSNANLSHIALVVKTGAKTIVAGSAIYGSKDPAEAVKH